MDTTPLLLVLITAWASVPYVAGQCSLDVLKDFDNKKQPVFMTNKRYMNPSTVSCMVDLAANQEVVIACPGNTNYVVQSGSNNNKKPKLPEWVAKCVRGKTFTGSQGTFELKELSCFKQPEVKIHNTRTKCLPNAQKSSYMYQVGYEVMGTHYPLYESCFDDQLLTTYHVKHFVKTYSCLTQQGESQSFQMNGMFKGLSMDNVYSNQKSRFNTIFGPSQKYITSDKTIFHKGHLASRADSTMSAELRATYQYINALPQWYTVNAPRWSALEQALRDHLKKTKSSATVYTGGYEVLALPKRINPTTVQAQPVYLASGATGTPGLVPVPLYFYKLVQLPGSQMAYVIINWDGFSTSTVNSLKFCSDKCQLNWSPPGSFCCTYSNFKAKLGNYSPV